MLLGSSTVGCLPIGTFILSLWITIRAFCWLSTLKCLLNCWFFSFVRLQGLTQQLSGVGIDRLNSAIRETHGERPEQQMKCWAVGCSSVRPSGATVLGCWVCPGIPSHHAGSAPATLGDVMWRVTLVSAQLSSILSQDGPCADLMGYEESRKHLLSLSYTELKSLCKRYNLPANKTHTQLASSLASLLEASLATSPAPLSSVKEASTGSQINLKRRPYSGRDDGILLVRAKHQKGPQTVVDGTSKRGIDTSTSICPVSISYGRPDCHGRSSSEPGNAHNVQSQSVVGIANKSTNPEPASEHHISLANIIDQTSAPIIQKGPVIDDGLVSAPFRRTEDAIGKGCGPSDMISANASPVQFFVMKDEGIDLVVDLDSTPSTWAKNFKAEVNLCIPPDLEPGNVSSFISSLVSKDDHSTISPSGNIVVDVQSKRAEFAPSTNSSLGSDAGDNSHSEPYPADRTNVNSVSSASTFPSTLIELSGYQEGAPVVSSSCLTADVQNNMTSDMMVGALDNEVLPPKSVDVLARSERITAALIDASVQSTGYKDTMSPCKTKVSGKIGCAQTISVADADSISAFSLGDVVRNASNEDSCPKSAGKQTVDIPGEAQLAHNGDTHEVLMEPMERVSMEKDTGSGYRLSISCQLARQTVAKLPVTDAQSDASSADHCIAGNFDVTNPTSSSAAS